MFNTSLPRHITVGSVVCGVLFSVAWWVYIDGVVTAPDAFPYVHLLPAMAGTIALIMVNIIPISYDSFSSDNVAIKVWLFIWFTVSSCAIMGALWITAIEYPPDVEENWPGVSIIVQTTLLMIVTLFIFMLRLQTKDNDSLFV